LLELSILAGKTGVWLAAGWAISGQVAVLHGWRGMLTDVVTMSLTMPLFSIGERGYSVVDLVELPAILAVVWIAVAALTHLFRSRVLTLTRIDPGVQETVVTLGRHVLMFICGLVVLQSWGVDVRSLALVASVLGVGIGFGLQNIANNFVSGLVVSVERPIQPGDFVKIGDLMGTVEKIGARSTEIRTLDNLSILIPNSRFLDSEVINWSHRDPLHRLHLPVGVAYGSDTAAVRAALLEAAHDHPFVLKDPRPRVELRGFGDSSLNFELLVWSRDPRSQFRLQSDLNWRIEDSLRRHGLQIPFPQRDLHLRSPQIERLVEAWGRRHFSDAELRPVVPVPATTRPPIRFEDEVGPRLWAEPEIERVAERMRGDGGLDIADRRHLLAVYRACFVGRSAVDWMVRNLGLTRDEAIGLGQTLVDRGVIRHVLDEHNFKDENLFYAFR
jgi:small-conductance mechanosensitive channel